MHSVMALRKLCLSNEEVTHGVWQTAGKKGQSQLLIVKVH